MTEQQKKLHKLIGFDKHTLQVYTQFSETAQQVLETNTPMVYEYGYEDENGYNVELDVWIMPKDQSPQDRVIELKKMIETLVKKIKVIPKWVSVMDRLPEEEGYYFVKGKKYGGCVYFALAKKGFDIPTFVNEDDVSDEHLYWLEE